MKNLTLKQVLQKYSEGPQTGIFTDGGSRPNPGPGGWGVVRVANGEVVQQLYGSDPMTTNNRMEMTAIINALKSISVDEDVTIYADSQLCINTLTVWAKSWERNAWKKKGGEIKNLDLVQEAYALFQERPRTRFEWIAGHGGWLWNEYVDSLSAAWAREVL